jgi:hypothetical protein
MAGQSTVVADEEQRTELTELAKSRERGEVASRQLAWLGCAGRRESLLRGQPILEANATLHATAV